MANQNDYQHIIDATDMVSLVSRYVKLEKAGKNYRGLCPFHHEDTPSFIVSPDKKLAHCFGCNSGGNPVNFLMQIENIDYIEAIAKLAEINGISYTGFKPDNRKQALSKYYKIMQTAQAFYKKYFENTNEGIEARTYLYKRGLDDEIIKMFNIGLAPSFGDSLYQVLKESGFIELDIADVSLIEKNNNGYYDLFSDRIMFPIIDENGNTIAFSARIFKNIKETDAKYINSKESILFKKSEVLFNLNLAKSEILKRKRIILHEGQMDVIASYRSGLKEAVCTLGTALTENQVKLILKYTNNIVICYDGDKAGINASLKAIKLFKKYGFNTSLVLLPNKMDPDEYVNEKGSNEYVKYFESHIMDANSYIFEVAFINCDLNNPTDVENAKRQVFESLIGASQTEIEKYLNLLKDKLNSSYESVLADYNTYFSTNNNTNYVDNYPNDYFYDNYQYQGVESVPNDVVKPIISRKYNHICELRLFVYAKASKSEALYIDKVLEDRINALSPNSQRLWLTLINEYYENYDVYDEGIFIKMLSQDDLNYYLEVIEILRGDNVKYDEEDRNACLLKLKELSYEEEINRLKASLTETTDITFKSRIIDKIFSIKRKITELKKTRRK